MTDPSTTQAAPVDGPAPAGAKPQSSRRRRRWLIALSAMLLLLILVVVALPTLLSTGPGNRLVLSLLNGRIDGTLSADRIAIGWNGGLEVTNATLRDPDGVVVIDGLDLSGDQLGVLDALRQQNLGEVSVIARAVDVLHPAGQPTNLQSALHPLIGGPSEPSDEPVALPPGLGLTLNVAVPSITYRAADDPPAAVHDLALAAELSDLAAVTASVSATLERDGATGALTADAALRKAFADDGRLTLDTAELDATADVTDLPLLPVDRLVGMDGRLVALLGEQLRAQLHASGNFTSPVARIDLSTPNSNLNLSVLREGDAVRFESGSAAELTVTPVAFSAWLPKPDDAGDPGTRPRLTEPVVVQLSLGRLAAPVRDGGLQWDALTADAGLMASPIRLDTRDGAAWSVSELNADLDMESLSEGLDAELTATVSDGATTRPLRIAIQNLSRQVSTPRDPIDPNNPNPELIGGKIVITDAPVDLLDAWLQHDGRLVATLGPSVSVDLEGVLRERETLGGTVTVSSANVEGSLVFGFGLNGSYGSARTTNGSQAAPEPADWQITLTPEAFNAWLSAEAAEATPLPVALAEPVALSLRIDRIKWSAKVSDARELVPDVARTEFQARLRAPRIALRRTGDGEPLPVLRSFRTSLSAESLDQPIELRGGVNLDAASFPSQSTDDTGNDTAEASATPSLTWHAVATDLVDDAGRLDPQTASYTASVTGRDVPTALVDALLNQNGQLAATLGPVLTPRVKAEVRPGREATAEIDVRSTYATGRLSLHEDLTDDAYAPTLREDPEFTLAVSPGAVQAWLGSLHPVFADVLRSAPDAPARLRIDAAEFKPGADGAFDVAGLNAEATLSLGVLEMDRQGWLRQGVTGLIRQVAPNFRRGQAGRTYLAKFTPMRITVRDGVVDTSELWLSADDFGVGFSGSVDLNTNTLDMGVGVLGATFIAVYPDLAKVLEPGRVYELPIEGAVNAPTMGYGRFVGQVATAYGQRELLNNDDLGRWGRVLGDIGGEVIRGALNWENPRQWSPSEDAQAFAVSVIPEPEPEPADPSSQGNAEPSGASTPEQPAAANSEERSTAQDDPESKANEPDLEDQLEEVGIRILRDLLKR